MAPLLTAQHLARSYGTQTVLVDVSVAIEEGDRIGLLGANGSGKSTLGRILAGVEPPDTGTLARRKGLRVGFLAQEPHFEAGETAAQVVERGLATWRDAVRAHGEVSERLGAGESSEEQLAALLEEQQRLGHEVERLGGWQHDRHVRALLAELRIDPERVAESLSGGERRRVAIAQVLVASPDLTVLDEPTNHLDAQTAEWLEEKLLEEFKGALVLVTHDRYFLDRVVGKTWELDRGVLRSFEGNYARYLERKDEQLALEARTEQNRLNVLRREREWLARSPAARTGKQKARIQRAEQLVSTVQREHRAERRVLFELAESESSEILLECEGLSVAWSERTLVKDFSLRLRAGERLALLGENGSGKTSLLRTLLGEVAPRAGWVRKAPRTQVLYFDQGRTSVDPEKSVWDNVFQGSDAVQVGGRPINIHSWLERFLFSGAQVRQKAGSLSGGERARLALAMMLRGSANLLVLDEPTNDLDLPTLSLLEELVLEFAGAVLIVSHDRWLLDRVASGVLAFEGDGKVLRYAGGYEDYCVQRAMREVEAAAPEKPAAERKKAPEKAPAKQGLSFAEKRELEGIAEKIDAAEKRARELEAKLADPAIYAQGGQVKALQAEHEKATAEVDALMARWETLEARKETS